MYSVLARYHLYSGNENTKTTMNELFGSETVCASTIIPANIKLLSERLPNSNAYSVDYIISNHTLFPYFAPFLPEERYQTIKLMMSEGNGMSLYMKLGKTASTIKSPFYLRYCPQCINEDKAIHGECFWHRVHQVEGIKVCPKHCTLLIESCVRYSERRNKHEFITLEKSVLDNKTIISKEDKGYFKHLNFISSQTYYLLNNIISPFGLENLRSYYITRLKQEGLVSVSGRVKWLDFIPMFNQFYGLTLLKELNCYISIEEEDTWLHKVLRKPKVSCHPLRHILLLGFLGDTILSLSKQINCISYKPFRSGPWPCLNKVADHFQKPVINSCIMTRDYKTGKPVGTFSCSCGFVYSRRGPDNNDDDCYKIGRIKAFGPVWERKLSELSKQNLSLRKRAEILGVDPMTVKSKLSNKLVSNVDIKKDISIEVYRREWANLIENNKEKTITEIRYLKPKIYIWLYRHDKDWLQEHYPTVIKSKNNHKRVDWETRDLDISKKVEKAAKEIVADKSELLRVTKNEIGRRIKGVSLASLYKNLSKMPQTEIVLTNYVESIEEFQVRRIKHITSLLRESKSSIKEWEIVRAVGLRREFVEKHKVIIKQEISDLS